MEIIFFVLGALTSWIISHYYYKKGGKERPAWFSEDAVKEVLMKRPEDIDWTAKELVKLYNNKVYDNESEDPLPFNFCPRCGSEDLERSNHTDEGRDENYFIVRCKNCEWEEWTQ
jgi:hypothetical protein